MFTVTSPILKLVMRTLVSCTNQEQPHGHALVRDRTCCALHPPPAHLVRRRPVVAVQHPNVSRCHIVAHERSDVGRDAVAGGAQGQLRETDTVQRYNPSRQWPYLSSTLRQVD